MEDPKKYLIKKALTYRRQSQQHALLNRRFRESNQASLNCESFAKGTEFETFVVRRFDPNYFTLIEWRSDKNVDGNFPLMSKFPDLEFCYESNSEIGFFAVECKWRETFWKEKIVFDKFQMENYRDYERVTGHKTFLILGVGNVPSCPNRVYIIPLKEVTSETLHEFELEIFQRKNPIDQFFIKCNSGLLH